MSRVVILVIVLFVAVLLEAGCVGQNSGNPTPDRFSINNTSISTIPTTIISQSTHSGGSISPSTECPGIHSTTNSVISGDPFIFSHSAIRPEGNLVRIWILGDTSASWSTHPVRPGILNTIILDHNLTSQLKSGTYYLLFEYADYAGLFKITTKDAGHPDQIINADGDLILDIQRVRKGFVKGLEARTLLEQAINAPGNDVRSENSSMNVEEPWIFINPVPDIKRGTPFTINGTTNLPANRPINMKLKLTIWPTQLDLRLALGEQSVEDYGSAFSTYLDVEKGNYCANSFSIDIPGLDAKPGEYFVSVLDYNWDTGKLGYAKNRTRLNIM